MKSVPPWRVVAVGAVTWCIGACSSSGSAGPASSPDAGGGGGGGGTGSSAKLRILDPVPDHALRPSDDPTSIVRRTFSVALTRDASVVVGRSEIFVLADGSAGSQGEEVFRWTEATGTVGLGFLSGGPSEPREAISRPTLVSADGSIVIGESVGAGGLSLFRWTAASGMTALGALNGTDTVALEAMSRDGSVAVGSVHHDLDIEAARWTPSQGFVPMGKLPGDTASEAKFVSEDGSIAFGSSSSDAAQHAVRFTASGIASLGQLPGRESCGIGSAGVAPDGSVVVGACRSMAGPNESFLWSESLGMISLGAIAGHGTNGAMNVSSNGATVAGISVDANDHSIAFGWTKSTGMVPLLLPGHVSSFPYGISADGSTIVLTSTDTLNRTTAVRWTAASGLVELVPLAGDDVAAMRSVSADGSIVAGWSANDPAKPAHAVYWDAQNRLHSIASELSAAGVDLQGYELSAASILSNDGAKIFHGVALGPAGLREWIAWLP
jgi:uncharacterized membrane protein